MRYYFFAYLSLISTFTNCISISLLMPLTNISEVAEESTIDGYNFEGNTLLHDVILNADNELFLQDTCENLINSGNNPLAFNSAGKTCIELAEEKRKLYQENGKRDQEREMRNIVNYMNYMLPVYPITPEDCQILLERLNAQNTPHETAASIIHSVLRCAYKSVGNIEIYSKYVNLLCLLLSINPVGINERDENGRTVLDIIILYDLFDILEILIFGIKDLNPRHALTQDLMPYLNGN